MQIQESNQFDKEKKYWLEQLSGEFLKSSITYDFCDNEKEPSYLSYQVILNREVSEKIIKVSGSSEVNLLTIMTAMIYVLIFKYIQVTDITIGIPIFKQKERADYINTVLVIRKLLDEQASMKELIISMKSIIMSGIEHQNISMENLIYQLGLEITNEFPLFDIVVLLESLQEKEYIIHTKPSLLFAFSVEESCIHYSIEYNHNKYETVTIANLSRNLNSLIENMITDMNISICDVSLLSKDWSKKILEDFNDYSKDFGCAQTIHKMIEQQAKLYPDRNAVIFGNRQVTYEELNTFANKLAAFLRNNGIQANKNVGLLLNRSTEMIIAMLGILKAGGAYVPIDKEFPKERIEFIIKDADIDLLLTDDNNQEISFQGKIFNMMDSQIYAKEAENVATENNIESTAYVIYTSGSTGKPKGVVIKHKAIFNTLAWRKVYYGFNHEDIILQIPAYTFDSSVEDIFTPLISGGCLVLLEQSKKNDVGYIRDNFEKYNITHFLITPRFYKVLLDEIGTSMSSLKKITIAGDYFGKDLVEQHYKLLPKVELHNEYGPTENSVCSTVYLMKQSDSKVLIGKPISNVMCYVLDKDKNVCPIGVSGELYLSGSGQALGYLNNEDLTNEKFIMQEKISKQRLYRTGDLVRWDIDGNLEFMGRIDNQVKIRGFRIETGEIENRLRELAGIQDVVVSVYENEAKNKELCAYYASSKEYAAFEIKEWLEKTLPSYMIPSTSIQIDKIPLTINGKIDYKKLPNPEEYKEQTTYVAPRNEVEEILTKVCQEVLAKNDIGVYDNLLKLGADSIKVIQIASRLLKKGIRLEAKNFFQYPIIAQLKDYVTIETRVIDQSIVTGEVPLTPVQKWFFHHIKTDYNFWNQTILLNFNDRINPDHINEVFEKLLLHHDALRMKFCIADRITQWNSETVKDSFCLRTFEVPAHLEVTKYIEQEAYQLQKQLNIEKGPLISAGIFQTIKGNFLLIAIHHLIMDAVSWRIFLEDFSLAYSRLLIGEDIELPLKSDSYKMWAEVVNEYAKSEKLLEELAYWNGIDEMLQQNQTACVFINKNAKRFEFRLSEGLTDKLVTNIHDVFHTSIQDILVAALAISLEEWSNNPDVLINLEGHGREDIFENLNVSRTIGWFTSDYPIYLRLPNEAELGYKIKYVKEYIKRIPNNGVGYGILKYISNKITTRVNPPVAFNYLGEINDVNNNNLFQISALSIGLEQSSESERVFGIEINCFIKNNCFQGEIIFDNILYTNEKIVQLKELFTQQLEAMIQYCEAKDCSEMTPSDLGSIDISLEELDDIVNYVGNL